MRQITNSHLEFLEEAKIEFEKNILRVTWQNKEGNLIALRYGADRDCINIFELGDEIAFFAQAIPSTMAIDLIEATGNAYDLKLSVVRTVDVSNNRNTMNIYAKQGDKVVFLNRNGYDWEPTHARDRGLVEGGIYTVESTEVGGCHTEVHLHEFPDCSFNSVMFADHEKERSV